jgi:hypothetical protein
MGKIISSSATKGTGINFFGGKVVSDDSWLEALPVNVIRSGSRHSGRTEDGVWVSAGASYGAQVEFGSEREADDFVKANPSVSRRAVGTSRPRVVCDTVAVFVAAYKTAATGRTVIVEQVKAAPVKTLSAALMAAVLEVEEEEKPTPEVISPKEQARMELQALGKTPEFIEKVLARMGF